MPRNSAQSCAILLRNSLTPRALAAYLQANPDSAVALNLKACNQFRLYDGKAAEAELGPLTKDAVSIDEIESALVAHEACVEAARRYTLERKQFGAPLAANQRKERTTHRATDTHTCHPPTRSTKRSPPLS